MKRTACLLTALVLATCSLSGGPLRGQQEKGALDAILDRIKAIPGQSEKPFSLIVQFKVKRDQVDAVLAAAKTAVLASRAEKGCVAYDLQQNLEDPTELFVLETWHDAKSLEIHAGTSHFAEFVKILGAAADEAPQMRLTRAVVPAPDRAK